MSYVWSKGKKENGKEVYFTKSEHWYVDGVGGYT